MLLCYTVPTPLPPMSCVSVLSHLSPDDGAGYGGEGVGQEDELGHQEEANLQEPKWEEPVDDGLVSPSQDPGVIDIEKDLNQSLVVVKNFRNFYFVK